MGRQFPQIKKIMLLVPNNIAGGAERVLTSLANEFSRKGYESYFMTFDSTSEFYTLDDSVHLLRLNAGTDGMSKIKKYGTLPLTEWKRYRRMKAFMKEIQPDVVLSFMFMANMIGWLCCKQLGIPLVLSERNDPDQYAFAKKKAMKYVYSQANGFVCQSDVVKVKTEQEYHLSNVVVIPNPINENQIEFAHLPNRKKQIIAAGRLIPQKNHALLIRAFAALPPNMQDYSLYIYGEGPLRGELEQLVDDLNMKQRIFMPGIEKDAIKNHRDATLFVMPSNYEGYPNALVEAMANGIASISTDFPSGSARTIIEHGKNGFLVPVGDENAMIEAIQQALTDTEYLEQVAENGKKIYEKTTLSAVADLWLDYFGQIVKLSGDKIED